MIYRSGASLQVGITRKEHRFENQAPGLQLESDREEITQSPGLLQLIPPTPQLPRLQSQCPRASLRALIAWRPIFALNYVGIWNRWLSAKDVTETEAALERAGRVVIRFGGAGCQPSRPRRRRGCPASRLRNLFSFPLISSEALHQRPCTGSGEVQGKYEGQGGLWFA